MSKNKTNFFCASAEDFKKIPGSPVAYWVSDKLIRAFEEGKQLSRYALPRQGIATGDNGRFLRLWHEVSNSKIEFCGRQGRQTTKKWYPCRKGGPYRRWYGNFDIVVNWENDGAEIRQFMGPNGRLASRPQNVQYNFLEGMSWSSIGHSFAMRYAPPGSLFETKGSTCFPTGEVSLMALLAFCNTIVADKYLELLAPTLDFHEGPVGNLPICLDKSILLHVESQGTQLISLSRADWDSYETSWDFKVNPLVAERWVGNSDSSDATLTLRQSPVLRNVSGASDKSEFPLSTLYSALRRRWAAACEEMRRLEIENNRIFIEAYGLQDELTPDVPWNEITLTCNPWYRYGIRNEGLGMRNEGLPQIGELEERLRADTVKELVSYAVGCMMGRYSLEKPGLILADQSSTIADYWEKLGELGIKDEELGIGGGCKSGRRNEELGMAGDALGDRALPSSASIPNPPSPIPHSQSLIPHSPSLIPHSQSLIPHSFSPDDDGIIPVLDNDWFADDIVTRFKAFVKAAFGEKHFFENMAWIEEALGKDIRSYFTKDFYKDHLQRYQNRPIYWLFQSPKGAFRALIYMHRYKPDMVGGVLGYLRSLQTKIDNQLDVAMRIGADESKSASERVQANKDVVKYAKAKKELDEYERNVLYPLSTERIEIDLDDGVKVNYRKFGAALAKVKALEGKGERQ